MTDHDLAVGMLVMGVAVLALGWRYDGPYWFVSGLFSVLGGAALLAWGWCG